MSKSANIAALVESSMILFGLLIIIITRVYKRNYDNLKFKTLNSY